MRQQKIDHDQIKDYDKEVVDKHFADKSISEDKLILDKTEKRIEVLEAKTVSQNRYEFDKTMNYMELKYTGSNRPIVQVYVYLNGEDNEAVRSECSMKDKDGDTILLSWQKGYKGYVIVYEF